MGRYFDMATIAFNYKNHDCWGKIGWLGTSEYYEFWGSVFAKHLADFFKGNVILDIGAGNGRVWHEALNLGLLVKQLNLIDPELDVTPELALKPGVVLHKKTLESLQGIHGDIVVFKQSIHHLHERMGLSMFEALPGKTFVNFSMPANPDWPMSPELKKKFELGYLNVSDVVKNAGKKTKGSFLFSYPVKTKRVNWCLMLEQRFTSILHDCDDDFISREVAWVNNNLPDTLEFLDHLECVIFE